MRSEQISSFLQERIDAGDFPSAVYLIAEKGEIVFQDSLGFAVVEPERIEARTDTIYDLASLTKPLVTGLLAARLIDGGEISLETRIRDHYPADVPKGNLDLTVRQLATHTSGLPAWLPLYLLTPSRQSVPQFIAEQPLIAPPNSKVVYSDLNFIILAFILQELRKGTEFGQEMINELGLGRTAFNPLSPELPVPLVRAEIAASENGNVYEGQTCAEMGYLSPQTSSVSLKWLRDRPIWGEVHDGNAFFMGGVAGHAGLFSTAEDVFRIAIQFLPNFSTFLKPETCELFRTNFTNGLNENRSFAFQLASTECSTAGTVLPPESFGHNGFTGTSLWIDPVQERIYILLTNRTHSHSLPFVNINAVRRRFHGLASGLLDKKSSN